MSNRRRLVDLDPSWVYYLGDNSWCGLFGTPPDTVELRCVGKTPIGISFQCPCDGRNCQGEGMRVAIALKGCPEEANWMFNKPAWTWSGTTFDTLTVSPSIDQSKTPGCNFHGWIRTAR